ncbi:UDP-glycosyltransferase UGT5-like isoform X1 [Eurosta solidaginis]|uniref:UDP-glycosyltransferase UGT5-like isoform X1 n=1 Tax=Eurosta solidaginis TaxID=178769 RepID=UPI003530F317
MLVRVISPVLIGFIFCYIILTAAPTQAARILGFFPTPSKSHMLIHAAAADALASAGHNVTIIGVSNNVYPKSSYKYIHINLGQHLNRHQSTLTSVINESTSFYSNVIKLVKGILDTGNHTLHHPIMRELLRINGEGDFDLVLLGYAMTDYAMGLGAHFRCPIIVSFMIQPTYAIDRMVGNPTETFHGSLLFTNAKEPLTFWGRVSNFMANLFEQWIITPALDLENLKMYNYNFPPDRYPPLEEVRKNVSLVFTNHHFSQGPIRPNVPSLIEIGGIQIKEKPDPLPADIAKILDESKEGAIYFSLGTNIQGSHLTKEKTKIIFNVISKLPYKVLWKWGEQDRPGQAKNIIYKEWLPQDDILAHPNIKLFITHGGMGSVVEAQYHGVPMVGIPLFGDQPSNMANVERSGYGLSVDYLTLTEESLNTAIQEVLNNPKYTKTVRDFSRLYRDRPMTPRQTVVYWTEYVLRHNGAKHMQSPAVHMNRWQLMSLDVIGFLLAILFAVVAVFVKICKLLCCRDKKGKETKLSKTKQKNKLQ